jgi:Na+-translocating ferredoxin:NAD+ oxidoreductase RnfD subunit
MISESAASNAAIQSQATQATSKKFQFDQRYVAPIIVTSLLIASQHRFGVLSLRFTLSAIVTAILVEIALSKYTTGKFPHLASAYISGISVGILIHTQFYWPFILCAAISIASKYVLRWEGRHLWNPSNFGICAMLLLAHENTATLMQQWDNRNYAIYLIWLVGAFTIYRLKRFHICATYIAAFLFFAWLRTFITGHGFWTEAGPITGPMYQLFIFFMITDPKTTTKSKLGQMSVALGVATMEMILRTLAHFAGAFSGNEHLYTFIMNLGIHAPYFALFTVGPVANVLEIWKNKQKASAKPELQAA